MLELFLSYFVGLFAMVDPWAALPAWLSLTKNHSSSTRHEVLLTTMKYVFAILTAFLLLGNALLAFFSISLDGIRIAGGMMLIINALSYLRSDAPKGELHAPAEDGVSIAFSPMAMPLLSGPGSIAVILGISGNIGYVWQSPEKYFVAMLAILCVTVVTYFVLLYSKHLTRVMGDSALHAMTLFMGFLLLCIGVQFIIDGGGHVLERVLSGKH